jgi:hypothetical protein
VVDGQDSSTWFDYWPFGVVFARDLFQYDGGFLIYLVSEEEEKEEDEQ